MENTTFHFHTWHTINEQFIWEQLNCGQNLGFLNPHSRIANQNIALREARLFDASIADQSNYQAVSQ